MAVEAALLGEQHASPIDHARRRRRRVDRRAQRHQVLVQRRQALVGPRAVGAVADGDEAVEEGHQARGAAGPGEHLVGHAGGLGLG
ncbi:MAG: hypothetical protein ACK559_37910, partial [bacterium]